MTIYLVQRSVAFVHGSTVTWTVDAFEDIEVAKQAAFRLQGEFSKELKSKLVRSLGGNEVEDTGLNLSIILGRLGIAGFKHDVVPTEVVGPRIVTASRILA